MIPAAVIVLAAVALALLNYAASIAVRGCRYRRPNDRGTGRALAAVVGALAAGALIGTLLR